MRSQGLELVLEKALVVWWCGCAKGCSGLPNTTGGNILMQRTYLQIGMPQRLWKLSLCKVYISTLKTFMYMLNFICVDWLNQLG